MLVRSISSEMVAASLPVEAAQELRALIDEGCLNGLADLPCTSVAVVGDGYRYNSALFEHASGRANENSILWLASCTKVVTAVAAMQIVEQGKLGLDDGEQLEKLCPELKDIKVLQEDGTLAEKCRSITLRMLLTNTGEFTPRRDAQRLVKGLNFRLWFKPASDTPLSPRH